MPRNASGGAFGFGCRHRRPIAGAMRYPGYLASSPSWSDHAANFTRLTATTSASVGFTAVGGRCRTLPLSRNALRRGNLLDRPPNYSARPDGPHEPATQSPASPESIRSPSTAVNGVPRLEMTTATAAPSGRVFRLRGRKEAEEYAAQKYPWLSTLILPNALYKLARDILLEE